MTRDVRWLVECVRRRGAAYLILFISLIPTGIAAYRVNENIHQRDQLRFDALARNTRRAIEQRVRHYLDGFAGIRGFFEASQVVEREEWRKFVDVLGLDSRFSSMSLVAFAQRVSAAEKQAHENQVRKDGFPDYRISSDPAGRAEYCPVVYFHPVDEAHRKYLGLDLAANPVIQETLQRADATGKSQASGKIVLPGDQPDKDDSNIAICVPVYRDGRLPGARPIGYVIGIIRLNEMFADIAGKERDDTIDFEVYGGEIPAPENLLYDNDWHITGAGHDRAAHRTFRADKRLNMAGGTWTLRFSSLPAFDAGIQQYMPWLTLLGGLAISGALFGIALVQVRGREVAERLTEDLRRAHERDRLVERATNDAIWDWDLAAHTVSWNEAMQTTFHYPADKVKFTSDWWEERVHPEDREGRLSSLKAAFDNNGEFWAEEYRFMRGDGSYATVIDRGFIVRDRDGKPVRMIGSVMDITERIRAQEEKNQALRFSQALVELTPAVAVQIFDREGRVQLWNPASEVLYGFRRAEVLGKRLQDTVLEPVEVASFNAQLEQIWTTKKSLEPYEWLMRTKDGEARRVYSALFPLLDAGECTAVCCMDVDITARKQAEDALAAEKERLSVTLRSIGDGVIATDTQAKVSLMNRVAEQLTGITQAAAKGRPLGEVFRVYDVKTRAMKEDPVTRVLEGDGAIELTSQSGLLLSGGREVTVAYSAAPICQQDSKLLGAVLVFRDISEEQRMVDERLRAGKLESLGLLAGGIAHDFNNGLTAILGNLSVAKIGFAQEDEAWKRLDDAEKAALRAKDLTQQLLTFAKGGAPIKRAASVAELVVESAAFALSGSSVNCETVVAPDLWAAEMDASQIGQVINNLVINAVQSMAGGGTVRVMAENAFLESGLENELLPGKYVKLSVVDNGVGIAPVHLAKIFDPYFTTKQAGHGLGLATSYSIVKKHEGAIRVKSIVGVGTTIEVYLPASLSKPEPVSVSKREMRRGQGRILVMDDDVRIRDLVTAMLRALGYESEVAIDGGQALKVYADAKSAGRPFAAVIMDLTIPGGMGGKETIKRMLAPHPEVKAIVSSGYSNDPVMSDYRAYGFLGVLAKPYKVEDLSNVLHQVIELPSRPGNVSAN